MEFFTLDSQLRRIAIFDMYESLIWTERYGTAGDFQLDIASDRNTRTAMSPGTFCTVDNTKRVCQIETVIDTVDGDGAKILKVSGRGIEAPLLGDRVATPGLASLTATPNWTMTGLPGMLARKIFDDIVVKHTISGNDTIPFISGSYLVTRTNALTNPSLATASTGWLSQGNVGTRVVFGSGWGWQVDLSGASIAYTTQAVGGAVGQFWAGSMVVSGPAGRVIFCQIHDAVGYITERKWVVLTGSPQTVKLTASVAAGGTAPRLYVYPDSGGGSWTSGQKITITNGLLEQVSGIGQTVKTFFDGSTPSASWTGTANASTSTRLDSAGDLFTPGSIAEPVDLVTLSLDIDSVYNMIVKICGMYKLGLRLARNDDQSQLYFDIYTGDDRTTLQTERPAVVFSPELDNLSDTSELTSISLQKNVAYVMAPNGARSVYADGWDQTTAIGFNRRVLYVDANDITLPAGTPLMDALTQKGLEKLSENQVVIAFDGEIPQFGSYLYGPGNDYDLGDLVEVRNSDGLATNMRVDEQIRTSDATGEKAYPTLVSELLITPGSWLAWDTSQYWDDAVGYWADA